MITLAANCMAREMAIDWRSPPDSVLTRASASSLLEMPTRFSRVRAASCNLARSSGAKTPSHGSLTGSRPRNRLRAIDRSGASEVSWWMVSMPSAMASRAERIVTLRPCTKISPRSIGKTPEIALIKVDLPAPLSPSSATTSPSRSVKVAFFSARTLPNDFWMFSRRSTSADMVRTSPRSSAGAHAGSASPG
jgi:hypothetical protein